MSDKKSWAVFVQPPSDVRQNFNQSELVKAMNGHMSARADAIRAEFEKAGMADQIEIGQGIPVLHMLPVKTTDAGVELLKTMKSVVHSVEPNIYTGPMPEEDRRLLEQRRNAGVKPKQGPNSGPKL